MYKTADLWSVYFAHCEYLDYINCELENVINKQHKQRFESKIN